MLQFWLEELKFCGETEIHLVLDQRCVLDLNSIPYKSLRRVPPTFFGRLLSQIKNTQFKGTLFCFGNLPPIFHSSSKVIVFLHNSLYFETGLLQLFPFRSRFRLSLEALIFKFRLRAVKKFLVQTPHMKRYLCDLMVRPDIVLVAPFADISRFASTLKRNGSFFCVSSGDPHKNIKNLILAWVNYFLDSL